MKINELIKKLQEIDGNAEIGVALRRGFRSIGATVPVTDVKMAINLDTNKPSYFIDVDLGWDYEMFVPTKEYIEQQKQNQHEGLFIPENKKNIYTTKIKNEDDN